MTHEELLAKIKGSSPHWKALRAVVELHKPEHTTRFEEPLDYCYGCLETGDDFIAYPCPTIRAIEKELNG